jgi:adenylate kinase family enzyme
MESKARNTFIFIGKSGSGKGTQARLLVDYLGRHDKGIPTLYIETGSLFRDFINGKTHTSKTSKKIMEDGGLQPVFLAVLMWGNALVSKLHGNEHIVADGTPRNLLEAEVLDTALSFYDRRAVIVHLEIAKKEATKRLSNRGREDDNAEDIQRRLSWFETSVMPSIEHYENHTVHKLITINGEHPIEDIHKNIISKLSL